ncbi:uracil-DNA glycosylase [Candidatus Phytoplasma pini]|uniref:Uracil-DNA glycosylase n=1 Tax=Candidatus Phytoplasma pini TaxID=267362 RepID=A0A559KIY9_9MOLU|nr:uracil-DNA glycosylase [Candidatus Phytoplasma pini]TVY12069.1 Uracil-DNA glycosylase [Candidatus Phytoplasma pini]
MWQTIIKKEKQKEYFRKIIIYLKKEIQIGKSIFPSSNKIFEAFRLTPWENLKVIILGQDPYPGINQAHGLSFSVNNNIAPPSLKNIFKELKNDLNIRKTNNNLTNWALEGVLLLNSILTVEKGKPLSHKNIGWEEFTKNIFQQLSLYKEKIVYILWGKNAQIYEKYINMEKNFVIKSAHPSPLSAHKGFFGSKLFSKTNIYLQQNKIPTINWFL